MHIFLQGPRGIGKSTVITKTLAILTSRYPLVTSGFYTWNGGRDDPHVYIKSARPDAEDGAIRVASWNDAGGGMKSEPGVFDHYGVAMLDADGANLVIMDELGFLESQAHVFKRTVIDTLAGSVPVFGVLRLGDVPWHEDIKRDPKVALFDVDVMSRDSLPQILAERIRL